MSARVEHPGPHQGCERGPLAVHGSRAEGGGDGGGVGFGEWGVPRLIRVHRRREVNLREEGG